MRQTNAAVPIEFVEILLWLLAHLHCPSGASLHYAVCHTPFSPHAFVRAATCVLRPTSFITSFVPLPLHHFRTYADASFHGFPPASTQIQHTAGSTFHFAIPTLQYSLGSINATLRPSFISVGFSPPAANNFACLACLPRLRVCHGF